MILLSYIVDEDYGFAPNPYWETLTLTTCKSPIRINAPKLKETHTDGFWIIGTGSIDVHLSAGSSKNYAGKLVFAMKVSKIMTLKEYDAFCTPLDSILHNKIPKRRKDFRRMVGDCIYRYPLKGKVPIQRPGLHCSDNIEDDLKGGYSLHSDDFYYFGANAVNIPVEFKSFLMKGQGYKRIEDEFLISDFIMWLKNLGFEKNSINGKPQLVHQIPDKFNNYTGLQL